MKGFFTCILSGSINAEKSTDLSFLVNEEGVTPFPYRKCEGKDAPTLKYRTEEYMGCWNMAPYPGSMSAYPLGIGGQISYSECADVCRSKGYHYFGRKADARCRCGGVSLSDLTFQMYGRVEYGRDHCKCNSTNIGTGYMACAYRLVDQWDPDTARQQHKCYHIPLMDMRKLCYISCRDENKSISNMFMCKTLKTTSLQHLSRKIAKWYEENSAQLHLLGGDVQMFPV